MPAQPQFRIYTKRISKSKQTISSNPTSLHVFHLQLKQPVVFLLCDYATLCYATFLYYLIGNEIHVVWWQDKFRVLFVLGWSRWVLVHSIYDLADDNLTLLWLQVVQGTYVKRSKLARHLSRLWWTVQDIMLKCIAWSNIVGLYQLAK
jgi:hypothetical protein